MTILSAVIGVFMAMMVFFIRMRASKKPASLKKIILPPFFMSTGFSMFLYPPMHVHVTYALFAFFVGTLLSYPLIVTSKFEVIGKDIYLKRSKAFVFILIGLVLLRLALKSYVGMYVSMEETAGLFFILAFGMIVPWRIAMYVEYMKLHRSLDDDSVLT
ncbi:MULTISPECIES: CcdC family protein [Aneurinibacillus]|jgi:membrane protein CcdC involved in cytochrome C biogenesis|uniref:Protein CcdC n=1 Tax=Aneurinibacillus danicus TaxID=267746 RepID=A0A511VCT4_9BACL|nr:MULTISPECIES: cytochrome c biogenesis protein CcdC [Aneurinibacillus]GEN36706.1 protein CcdC [Aneurinibacillus danicus]